MRKHLRKRPSPAMGVALIALFIALGGTTYAATGGNFILGNANTATTPSSLSAPIAGGKALQLTNTNTTAGSTALGLSVASGRAPFTVNSSGKVTNLNADRLDSLDSTAFLRTTGKAADADKLDGLDSTSFAKTAQEAWHVVGAAGEPAFTDTCDTPRSSGYLWNNYGFFVTPYNEVAFYKDSVGIVHLRGLAAQYCPVSNGAGTTIFTLPPGYRPAEIEVQVTVSNNTINRIDVQPTGEVFPTLAVGSSSNQWVSLDGITFRAA